MMPVEVGENIVAEMLGSAESIQKMMKSCFLILVFTGMRSLLQEESP